MRLDRRAVLLFGAEANQHRFKIFIYRAQGGQVGIRRSHLRQHSHYPCHFVRTEDESDALDMELGAAVLEGGRATERVINAVSARSTWLHASRTASASVISWLIPILLGKNCTCIKFCRRAL